MVMEYVGKAVMVMEQISIAECGRILARTVGIIILQILMAQIALVQIVMAVG